MFLLKNILQMKAIKGVDDMRIGIHVFANLYRCKLEIKVKYEPPRGKTNNVVSEQVRHKPACRSTEKS